MGQSSVRQSTETNGRLHRAVAVASNSETKVDEELETELNFVKRLRRVIEMIQRQRPHANFFAWPDRSPVGKSVAECGTVSSLLESMELAGDRRFTRLRASRDAWPDCLLDDPGGREIAVEVTELVDSAALSGQPANRINWSGSVFIKAIEELLLHKDRRSFRHRKGGGVLLVIHTDEPALIPRDYGPLLDSFVFPATRNIREAYFLFSFDASLARCPYWRLRLGA
jgi:hypothetical protein